jgi:hypothetical protein
MGFLNDRILPRFKPYKLTTKSEIQKVPRFISVEYTPEADYHMEYDMQSILSKRAWALQERLLSNRILSFKANRMHWECNSCCYSENLNYPYVLDWSESGRAPKRSLSALNDASDLFDYWVMIVQEYSGCELTKWSDRLPTLSGIAKSVSALLRDEYLAGIWKSDIRVGLSWHSLAYLGYSTEHNGSNMTKQPSWTWASDLSRVQFYCGIRNMN